MSLADVISDLGGATYQVIRTAAGARVNGRVVAGPATTFPIVAGIEPITGRELQDLPEGQRGDEVIQIFTATPLLTRRPGFEPDQIVYRPPGYEVDGEPWTVTCADVLEGIDGVHYEVKACRAPSQAGVVP
jgi:hypothetical protein